MRNRLKLLFKLSSYTTALIITAVITLHCGFATHAQEKILSVLQMVEQPQKNKGSKLKVM